MIQWPQDKRDLLRPAEAWGLLGAIVLGLVLWFAPGLVIGFLIWG